MPDANHPHRPSTSSWNEAFAALPLETPDVGGWDAVSARLEQTRSATRRRWPTWLAVAAVLALAVGLPLRWAAQHTDPAPDNTTLASDQHPTAAAPTTQLQAPALSATNPATQRDVIDAPAQTSAPSPDTDVNPDIRRLAATDIPEPAADTPTASTVTSASPPSGPAAAAPAAITASSEPTPLDQAELDSLYAESAHLEALLAVARDERVASASAALISDHYDDQVGSIDAALMQPSLTDRQRTGLWRERVATLRQQAGFESTQRVLAAYGQRDDARLVSIN